MTERKEACGEAAVRKTYLWAVVRVERRPRENCEKLEDDGGEGRKTVGTENCEWVGIGGW